MSTKIGDLKVSIGADTRDLSRGIGRAKAMMGGLANAAKSAGVAAAASFVAVSVGMAAMTRQGLEFVDTQAKTARTVDGTIDGLRALQIASADAGVAIDETSKAVQNMGKRIAEAARDGFGPAHDALEMLGLSASDLMNMDVDARFGAIADRVKELGFNAQQSADLMRQFGVRSNEVALVLLQGSGAIKAARQEVERFGLSISDEMAAKVERANDAMSRMSFVFEGMRNQLAVGLAPVLERLALNFQDATQAGGPLQGAITSLVDAFSRMAEAIINPAFAEAAVMFGTTIANGVAALAEFIVILSQNAEIAGVAMVALGGAMLFFSGPIGLAIAAVAAGMFLLATNTGKAETAADLAAAAEEKLHKALAQVDISNAAAVASGEQLIATHIDQARAALEAAKANLILARSKETSGNALLDQNPLTAGGNSGMAEEMAANRAAAQVEFDAADDMLARHQKTLEGFKRSQFPSQGTRPAAPSTAPVVAPVENVEKLTQALDKLVTRIDPAKAKADQYAASVGVLDRALAAGVITQDEYSKRLTQLDGTMSEVPARASAAAAGIKAIGKAAKESADDATTFSDDLDGALGNLINNIENGKDAIKSFAVEVVKMLAIRGISSILGGSNWFDGPLIGKNAMGTDNWRGGLSWVGERGPELVNLPRGAAVTPNHRLSGMGGGMSFTYAPTIDARGASMAAVQELEGRMRADAAQFDAKVVQAVRKGQSGRNL